VGLKLNATQPLLDYAENATLLGYNIEIIKANKKRLIDAGREFGLEVNVEKTKYMLVSHHQSAS
jgi:hypothetical protein